MNVMMVSTDHNPIMPYDFARYKQRLSAFLTLRGIEHDTDRNFRCFLHEDGGHPSEWSMKMYDGERLHCYGCGFNGDIYDVAGELGGITDRGEQFRAVASAFCESGDAGGDSGRATQPPRQPVKKTKSFEIDAEAMTAVVSYLRSIRADHTEDIAAFCRSRGFDEPAYGKYLAWWPGRVESMAAVGTDVLDKAGIPANGSWNPAGVVCRFETGLKLQYVDGSGVTVKRGSHGSRVFPYPDLPDAGKHDAVILVEGEFDALSCRYAGIENAVAIGGTNGLSREDAKRLHQYRRIVLLMDNDEPGEIASGKRPKPAREGHRKTVLEIIQASGYRGTILRAVYAEGDEKDPDEMVKRGHAEALRAAIDAAEIIFDGGKENESADTAKSQNRGEGVEDEEQEKTTPPEMATENQRNANGKNETSGPAAIDPPFQFLGEDETQYWILPKDQNIPIHLPRGNSGLKNWLPEIAPQDWWFQNFHKENADGDTVFDVYAAMEWFRREEHAKHQFNDEKIYGVGAHRDHGKIILNTGNELIEHGGGVTRYEDYTGSNVYTRSKITLDVSAPPWTREDGQNYMHQLYTFNFEKTLHYFSIAGYVACAPFASILHRRPHIWITGKRGLGKSYLIEYLIIPMLGDDYVFDTEGGTTEAAIRQSIGRDSRPPVLDEFEANNRHYDLITLQSIIALARSCYGGKRKVKGSASQKAITYATKMMFCFASINVNLENDADKTRISVCRMKETLPGKKCQTIPNPGGLRARIWARLPDLLENIEIAKRHIEEFKDATGNPRYDARAADTYGPLLAGAWMVFSDYPFLDEREDIKYHDAIAKAIEEIGMVEKEADEEKILERILQERIRVSPEAERTIAEMLTMKDDMQQKLLHDDALKRLGMRRYEVTIDGKTTEVLAVVKAHHAISKMLAETPFSNYAEVLRRNDAKIRDNWAVRMAGGKQETCILLDWAKIEEKYFRDDEDWKKSAELPF